MTSSRDEAANEKMLGEKISLEDTTCGVGCIKGKFLQRFANKKAFVFIYGLLGSVWYAAYSYYLGTITTLEKRFHIPSKITGLIVVGHDVSTLFLSVILTYYASKGHKPRWIAIGVYTQVVYCLMNALPYFLYGPGSDALALTQEYESKGLKYNMTTQEALDRHDRQSLCEGSQVDVDCEVSDSNVAPMVILFLAQLIAGAGSCLSYTLGVSYMDDNIKKSKSPMLLSFTYFIRLLGPAVGYSFASLCLKFYVSPSLTPRITNEDPRWLGAWWIGWLLLAVLLLIAASLLGLFPKTLPRAALRKVQENNPDVGESVELPASYQDMMITFKRLIKNKILMCNNVSAVFYILGYMPFWVYKAKYIEIIFKKSASSANFITGSVSLIFTAVGILSSGLIITKYKPRARLLAMWNVFVGTVSAIGILAYAFLGCDEKNFQGSQETFPLVSSCNQNCNCDYVKYSPVCAYGQSFISPCHAGCRNVQVFSNDCACVQNETNTGFALPQIAQQGPCPVDCTFNFMIFLAVICITSFMGSTGIASNFLVSLRCVDDKDKPVAMAFGLTLMCLFSLIPAPIMYGYVLDMTCVLWGKLACSGTSNCWLYNGDDLRYKLNFIAAAFATVGTMCDVGVWYFVKDLQIFDDKEEEDINLETSKDEIKS